MVNDFSDIWEDEARKMAETTGPRDGAEDAVVTIREPSAGAK